MKTKIYLLLLATTIFAAGCTNRNSQKYPMQVEERDSAILVLEESASGSDTQTAGDVFNNAMLITSGYGLNVYMEITGHTDCYDVCKLYIENGDTHDIYMLLETKGANQPGTKLPIKARNKAAYGMNEYGIKEDAGYEDGYLEAVEDVFVLSFSLIPQVIYRFLGVMDEAAAVLFVYSKVKDKITPAIETKVETILDAWFGAEFEVIA